MVMSDRTPFQYGPGLAIYTHSAPRVPAPLPTELEWSRSGRLTPLPITRGLALSSAGSSAFNVHAASCIARFRAWAASCRQRFRRRYTFGVESCRLGWVPMRSGRVVTSRVGCARYESI